ncbi:MAG: YCF48-related protein [Xanthomonadales bacterium]|nr:YCF48-related protein [Xanthomonadales bacterium]
MACLLWAPSQAQESDDPPPAERLPLAARSLLLDVTRDSEGRFVAVGERGHVVHSGDGREWTQAEHVPTRSTLTTVASQGNDLWAGGHDTAIIHSSDGGVTWDLVYYDPDRAQPVMDIHFVDAQTGYAIGAYGLMMKTLDGGQTWDEFEVSFDGWHLNGLIDLGDGRLLITGEKGFSYLSQDAGETWETIDMPYPGSMFGAVRTGGCIVVYGLRGNIQRTCDDGQSWEQLASPTENSLAGGAFREGETLLVGNSGQVVRIGADGAVSAEKHPSGVDFAAALPLDDGRWLLVGESGTHVYPALDGEGTSG